MIYLLYRDDGPKGYCNQSMSITCPWERLIAVPSNYNVRDVIRSIEEIRGRSYPRVTNIFATSDETDLFDYIGASQIIEWSGSLGEM